MRRLEHLLSRSARLHKDKPAIRYGDRTLSYQELDNLSARAATALTQAGVRAGDRIGLWLDKSPEVIALMQGALRLGAIYVPVDPLSPLSRVRTVLEDCTVSIVATTAQRACKLTTLGAATIKALCVDELTFDVQSSHEQSTGSHDNPAFILYTSGSTGRPKGVCISHRNALAFIDWAVNLLEAKSNDRFANHAPFCFDLSVLDLYAAFTVGACVCLVPEQSSYVGNALTDFLRNHSITVWYSVPSAVMLMMEYGGMLAQDLPHLRHLMFAGEVFPIRYLQQLRKRYPSLRLHNLYGPTESNVCTFFEINHLDPEQLRPVPIGRAACGNRVWAETPDGRVADIGEEGILMVSGPTVMMGYWGDLGHGVNPLVTGDRVRRLDSDNFVYLGRSDDMLKLHGYRIEAAEVEACLLEIPEILDAAVVVSGSGLNARLVAFLVSKTKNPPSLIALKSHCADRLPRQMIIDYVRWLPQLPRNGNGKTDRLMLNQLAAI